MTTNTDQVRALIDEMTDYLDQEVDPELDVIEQWRDRLEAALAQQPAGVDRDEVLHVAQHIGAAADYIDAAYPDGNMLDRGPILRNMRRWHKRLMLATLAAQQQGGRADG